MVNRILLILAFIITSAGVTAQKIHIDKERNGYWIMEDGKKIFFFQREINDSIPSHARCNYFHPVYDLNGNCITEDFPADHLHQRGIFWAWLQIMINNEQVCDGWHLSNFTQEIDQVEFMHDKEGNGLFVYSSFWEMPDKPGDPFMRENTRVTIYPRTGNYRRIDFTIELRALEHHLQIGGADNEKGYGGFSIRLKTDENTVFTDIDNKKVTPQELAILSGRLMDISNPVMKSGITLISWDENPDKTNWILRQAKSAQNIAWPGRLPVSVSVTKPTVLKYTLLIYNGKRKQVPLKRIIEKK